MFLPRFRLFFALLLACSLLFGCAVDGGDDSSGDTTGADSSNSGDQPSFSAIPLVRIATSSGNSVTVEIELARTPEEQSTGLMFRPSLDPFKGMLFIFQRDDFWDFTMENTLIPLDMIHLNSNQEVVGIIRSAVPETLGPYSIDSTSRYVLEVNGGFASREGVEVGDFVSFSGFSIN